MHIGTSVSPSFLPAQLDAIDRYLPYAERLGLNSIEIDFSIQGTDSPYAPLPHAWEESSLWAEVRRRLTCFELPGAHLPYVGVDALSDDPDVVKATLHAYTRSMTRAGELGCRYAVIHAVATRPSAQRLELLPRWVEHMGEMTECARQAGLILCLENAGYTFFLADTVHVIRAVDSSWLRMTLDTGHAMLRQHVVFGEPVCAFEPYGNMDEFIRREHDLLFTLHIHDNRGLNDDHLVIGEGTGDLSYLRTLRQLEFNGVWTFEHNIDDDWDSVERAVMGLRRVMGA
jgi:sugar phosphate isomerase/epimerase